MPMHLKASAAGAPASRRDPADACAGAPPGCRRRRRSAVDAVRTERSARRQRRRPARTPGLALLLALLVLLSGCAAGEAHVTVHADGTAELALRVSVPDKLAGGVSSDALRRRIDGPVRDAGFETAWTAEDGLLVWTAARRFDRSDWTSGDGYWQAYARDRMELSYSVDARWFYTVYRLNAVLDPAGLIPSAVSEALNGRLDEVSPLIRGLVLSRVDLKLQLTLPLPPTASNAEERADGGRTLVWHVPLQKPTPIALEITAPNVRHLAIAGAGGLAFLALAVGLLLRRRKRRKRRLPPAG